MHGLDFYPAQQTLPDKVIFIKVIDLGEKIYKILCDVMVWRGELDMWGTIHHAKKII